MRQKRQKQFGLRVEVQDGKVDKALRQLKKKVENTNLMKTLRDNEFYTKPSVEKKLKRNAAKKRWEKHLRSQSLPPKLY